jgi:hypothetical protein
LLLPFCILNVSSPVLEKDTNVGVIDFGNCIQFPELSLKRRNFKFYIFADRFDNRLNSYNSPMLHLVNVLEKSIFVVHTYILVVRSLGPLQVLWRRLIFVGPQDETFQLSKFWRQLLDFSKNLCTNFLTDIWKGHGRKAHIPLCTVRI